MANVFPGRKVESVNNQIGNVTVREDVNYIHDQGIPSAIWSITHNLGKKCSVTITDTAGTVVEGRVTLNDGNQVIIEFNAPFSGEAVLN